MTGALPATVAAQRIQQGEWKADMVWFIEQAARPGDRAIEAGSGFGVTTLAIARAVEPDGIVVGYEPNAALCNVARGRIAGRQGCAVRWAALSPVAGRGDLREVDGEPWRSTVQPSEEGAIPVEQLDEAATVFSVNILVLDCEGAEYRLLTGSRLDSVRTVIVELHGEDDENAQLAANLDARGYERRGRCGPSDWDNIAEWWEKP